MSSDNDHDWFLTPGLSQTVALIPFWTKPEYQVYQFNTLKLTKHIYFIPNTKDLI